MKINPTESYVFFFSARIYRARIQLSFTNTRGIQYSLYVNPCVSPYRVLNLTLGWMDELGLYVPSTVFQSFRDDERVNMKGSVQ